MIDNLNKDEYEVPLTAPPHKPKKKVKGSVFLKFEVPAELVMDKGELDRLQKLSKLGPTQLAKIYKEFVIEGKQKSLKTKHDIVQMAKRCGLQDVLQSLHSETSGRNAVKDIDPKLKDQLYDDPEIEEFHYEKIMAMFDSNGDGEISLDEMVVGMSVLSSGTRAEKAELIFNIIDTNGDGTIDFKEMIELQRLSMKAFRAGFIVGFRYGSKELEVKYGITRPKLEELTVKLANCFESEEIVQIGAKLCMKYADANGDGTVTKEEYIKYYSDLETIKAFHDEMEKAVLPIAKEMGLQVASEIQNFFSANKF